MNFDPDLQSIQEVRNGLQQAQQAQMLLTKMTQQQVDAIVKAMAVAAEREAGRLAELAVEETGFGNTEDKTVKNLFASRDVYRAIRDMKTVGIIHRDEQRKVWEVAQPVGIIAGIVPSTNPTSTAIYKALISVKARNAIVFSPHPFAAKCTIEAVKLLREAAEKALAPQGLIQCIMHPTLAATDELMKHRLTNVILATGGTDMVRAAYSSGKPAYGVGPGNVPVYVHTSADVKKAVSYIIHSKTFDYGTICASEQALIVDREIRLQVINELKRQGAHMLNDADKAKLTSILLRPDGGLNARIVGRSPLEISKLSGITIAPETKLLVAEETGVGKGYPLSIEKLSPILALYTVENWQEANELSCRLLEYGGLGHTFGIHAKDEHVIESFALTQPASRIVVNTGTTFGGIGATTGIQPSMTLGCGSFGGNITSDNIGPQHLMDIKRIAFALREMEEGHLEQATVTPQISKSEVMDIIKQVLQEMK